ncbi:hypothetical protein NLX83_20695 [Allokutzneria sp. A3M-2-11 16]|uniref:hypothetical protein n=1 Tax=Allokutzneria sp. A3M-2-11 16 TaxID=2962043 RepID=UPI0020B65047|nr:hypothetical protein [Allokutzneria sp. A3M-2-11 16]MCP3801685.1 hypothetical protein [Allokutzneria sp. A3M-2-11 16]
MSDDSTPPPSALVLDAMCLNHFARIDRIGAGDRNQGEASVFAAAELLKGMAVTDDQAATRVARKYGLEVHGTVWLLARACRNGKQTVVGAGSLVDALRDTGMRLPMTGAEFGTWIAERGLM